MSVDEQTGRSTQVRKQTNRDGRHSRGRQGAAQRRAQQAQTRGAGGDGRSVGGGGRGGGAGAQVEQGGGTGEGARSGRGVTLPTARLFIACDLPTEIVRQIGAFSHKLHQELAHTAMKIRWVLPQSIHLTLRFLGDTDQVIVPALIKALRREVGDIKPFKVSVDGAGAFPDNRDPRVLWLGTDQKSRERMDRLHRAVEDGVTSLGFPAEERPFIPHITLGRVADSAGFKGFGEVLANMKSATSGGFDVDRVVLYKSKLQPGGPQYEALGYAMLGKGGGDEY